MSNIAKKPDLMILVAIFLATLFIAGCAPKFQTEIAPLTNPLSLPYKHDDGTLVLGMEVLSPEKQVELFNIDLTPSNIVPVRIIAQVRGKGEYFISVDQILGIVGADLYQAYDLDQAITRIRTSEIGKAMASSAAAGAVAGAAAGAIIGGAVGDSSDAAAGAAIGGTVGAASGAGQGADQISQEIKRELRRLNWGSRALYPNDFESGIVFMRGDVSYESFRLVINDVTARTTNEIVLSK